jgi:hypothetical protein
VATSLAFLRKYGLEKEFKINVECNHATLSGAGRAAETITRGALLRARARLAAHIAPALASCCSCSNNGPLTPPPCCNTATTNNTNQNNKKNRPQLRARARNRAHQRRLGQRRRQHGRRADGLGHGPVPDGCGGVAPGGRGCVMRGCERGWVLISRGSTTRITKKNQNQIPPQKTKTRARRRS